MAPHVVVVPDYALVAREGVRVQRRTPALVATLTELTPGQARSLLAWMIARRKIDAEEFAEAVAAHARRPGARRLRGYIPMVAERSASKAESLARAILLEHGVVGWEPNALVHTASGEPKSADFLFGLERLIVMIDGWRYHGDRRAFQIDRTDQNGLIAAGYLVLRFTWQDLEHRPGYVIERVTQACRLRRR